MKKILSGLKEKEKCCQSHSTYKKDYALPPHIVWLIANYRKQALVESIYIIIFSFLQILWTSIF